MKRFISSLRDVAIAGFFFLFPLYVVFIVLNKAWTSLSSMGTRIAGMFGLKSFMGVGGSTIASGLMLVAIWIACGLLVRFRFVASFRNRTEAFLARIIPGYDTYKALAEEKLQQKVKIIPYSAVLIKQREYWQPAYVVEEDGEGNYVVFLPEVPETSKGHVLVARREQVQILRSVTANQMDASLKKNGKGLLSDYRVRALST
jgi:uncharacterized membrane protein